MKKQIRYKIIELKTHQFLLIKSLNEISGNDTDIVIMVFHKSVQYKVTIGIGNEKERDNYFESFDDTKALNFISECFKLK